MNPGFDVEASDAERRRILLVARNERRIERVIAALPSHYRVESVPDDAAAIFRARQSRPDLVICALNTDESGTIELARRVHVDERLEGTPVVFLVDADDSESVLQSLEFGADEFILDPFDPQEFLLRIQVQFRLADVRGAVGRHGRAKEAEAETLNEIARGLASELDLDTLLQRVTDAGTTLTGAASGAFFQKFGEGADERFELKQQSGQSREQFEKTVVPIVSDLLALTVAGTGAVRVDDAENDPRVPGRTARDPQTSGSPDVRSFVAVPVKSRNAENIGALLFCRPDAGGFTSRSEGLALGLAAHVAVAIDNARLFRESRAEFAARTKAEADRDLLAAIVASSNDAIVSKTLDGIITSWNDGARRMFGYTADEAIGQPITMLIPPERLDEETDILARIRRGQHIDHFETIRVTRDGRRIEISLTISAIRDAEGRIVGASKVARDITLQRAAERAHAESEARFRQLVDALPAGVYQCDCEGRIVLFNDAAVELWGRTPAVDQERWCGAHRLLRGDGTDLPHEESSMARCLKEGRAIRDAEVIVERPDGTRRNVVPHVDPLFDASGELVGAVNVMMDVTERRNAEFLIREGDRQTIAILEGLPQLLWTCRPNGECDFLSKQWVTYTGQPAERQFGNRWLEVVHADDRKQVWEAWSSAVERAQTEPEARYQGEFRMRGNDGLYRWFSASASPLRDPEGRVIRWIGSNTNIQDIRDAEAALRYSEEKFRNLADNMSQFAWMADENWWIYWYNRRWFDYTGTTLADMQGWGWTKVHHRDHVDRVIAGVKESWRTGDRWEDVFPLRSKDGEYRWFLSRAEPIRDASGRVVRWFGTNTDITKQLEFESELKDAIEQAEAANHAKDRFLAILSHELRTPLTPVLMLASAMERDDRLPPSVRKDAGMIRDNIRLETRLIDDLLDLSRITAGKLSLHPERVDLNESIVGVCEMCSEQLREKSIRLHCDLDERVRAVTADPSRLQQVFWNVLKNAAKFTPAGGDIHISTRDVGEGFYRIEIRDSGIGIATDKLSAIFDAFEQAEDRTAREFGGLGLGLAISKALVEIHHGSIRAESEGLGKGARFVIELPIAQTTADIVPLRLPLPNGDRGRPLHLLVVEDHRETAATLERVLKSSGYRVSLADCKANALEFAANHKFDVLVSDIGLPDGTGYELVAELRKRRPIRAIAISGYGMDDDLRKSLDAGFDKHLVKPLDIAQLEQAIRDVDGAFA